MKLTRTIIAILALYPMAMPYLAFVGVGLIVGGRLDVGVSLLAFTTAYLWFVVDTVKLWLKK